VSGEIYEQDYTVGDFVKFNKVFLNDEDVVEILSVTDSEGHEYYEVDYLSQDVIYKFIANADEATQADVPSVLKPMAVPRRFVLERDELNRPYLQFGTVSNNDILNEKFVDPSEVAIDLHGRDYVIDKNYDPSNFFINDKFGIAPANTDLTISFRSVSSENVNLSSNTLTQPVDMKINFKNELTLPETTRRLIFDSVQVDNPSPITGDVDSVSVDEAKVLAFDSFSTQNRAVTKNDYVNLIYRMPPQLGGIKRTNVFQDNDSFKRNINVYVLSEDSDGNLQRTNGVIKNNLKTWINSYKMINDTIDILDAHVVNLGIDFTIMPQPNVNKYDALAAALDELQSELLSPKYNIGEPFYVTDVYRILKEVDEVLDVINVVVTNKTSTTHSSVYYNIDKNMSKDGRVLASKENICFEIKYPDDIKGAVV